ncbi:helix-turn-helix domain-containing protein, partial [Moraxella nonliquefaciens]|uniref:helix-turn-helix domain-containing protein n=1 Tax=Moraxella nonliquefaciens TaxID=478 RepID=UPI001EF705D9
MGGHLEWNVQPDLKSNISISEIARRLGCHKSIISREIKRNTGLRGYRPKQA